MPLLTLGHLSCDIINSTSYIGSSFYDSANDNSLPSTTLFDASMSYDFSSIDASFEGWHAQVNANNVTDKGVCKSKTVVASEIFR